MPLSDQQRTIRLGLALQACVEIAIERHIDVPHQFTQSESLDQVTPDVVFSLENNKYHVMEITNSDVRDSFRMKVLRYLESVSESKVAYGLNTTCSSLLFGDAKATLPDNSLSAMCSFFDAYVCVQNVCPDSKTLRSVRELEQSVYEIAHNERIENVPSAVRSEVDHDSGAILFVAAVVGNLLESKPNRRLELVWKNEINFRKSTNSDDVALDGFGVKRAVMDSLLLDGVDPNHIPLARVALLCDIGIGQISKSLRGEKFELREDVARVMGPGPLNKLRARVLEIVSESPSNIGIMQDMLDEGRIRLMVEHVLDLIQSGDLSKGILECYLDPEYRGIIHGRCWVADIVPLIHGKSHNWYNKTIVADCRYRGSLANPYPNLVGKTGFSERSIKSIATIIADIHDGLTEQELSRREIENRLMKFRYGRH